MRTLTDGERDIWNELQADAAPDHRTLRETKHKASKAHTCDACGGIIHPGEMYWNAAHVVDDEFIIEKTHAHDCWEDRPF